MNNQKICWADSNFFRQLNDQTLRVVAEDSFSNACFSPIVKSLPENICLRYLQGGHYYGGGYFYNSSYGSRTFQPNQPFFIHILAKTNLPRNQTVHFDSPVMVELAQSVKSINFVNRVQNPDRYTTSDMQVVLNCKYQDESIVIVTSTYIAEQWLGLKISENFQVGINNGLTDTFHDWKNQFGYYSFYDYNNHGYKSGNFDFTFNSLNYLKLTWGFSTENTYTILKNLVTLCSSELTWKPSGVSKVHKQLEPFLDNLRQNNPGAFCAYRSLVNETHTSVEGVKRSVVFNDVFGKITTEQELVDTLKTLWLKKPSYNDSHYCDYNNRYDDTAAIKNTQIWKTKRKAVIKSGANRAFSKLMEEYEFLALDEEKYPLTSKTIKEGELPLSTFFRKSEQYFLLNDNWDLWEVMLKKHKDVAIEIAKEASRRTTYEKDIMSYFYFILYALPEYLKLHTGKRWQCIPRLVENVNDLEPPKADDTSGITRSRSALTPIVDNNARTVVVPYASLAVGGSYGTTYCYSHDYHLIQRGFNFNGNAVLHDLEEKLNGRDDYGLMFYTLTGSSQGRGYPTFLIIFERRVQKGDTKVHFHRTHPSRSKGGDYNSVHNWIKVCYNWMAGNVRRDLIKAQQGDLFFVEVSEETNLDFQGYVDSYDQHKFEIPKEQPLVVEFAPYTKAATSNILGYVRLKEATWLRHPEHDDVLIPAGTFAIHQCRSWEANPKGIWSLRID